MPDIRGAQLAFLRGGAPGPALAWWKSRGWFKNVDAWLDPYATRVVFETDDLWVPFRAAAVTADEGYDAYRDGAFWQVWYRRVQIPGEELADQRPAKIAAAEDRAREEAAEARREAQRQAAAAKRAAADRQRAYDQSYRAALGSWTVDDETQILVILLPGQKWHGETGPKLVPGPRRKAWETSEGQIPFPPGAVIGFNGQLQVNPTVAQWGSVLVNAGQGWRPPYFFEIWPYLNQGQKVAADQAASEAVGERISRNRAQISATQNYTNRAAPGTAGGGVVKGGKGAELRV